MDTTTRTDRTQRVIHVSAPGHKVHHAIETTWLASGNVAVADPWCGSRRRNGWRNEPGTTRTNWCDKPACIAQQARCPECTEGTR